jgi:hypothetical protein
MHLGRGTARDARGSDGTGQICAAAGGAGGDADAYGEGARNGVHSGADSGARPGGRQSEAEGVVDGFMPLQRSGWAMTRRRVGFAGVVS